MSKAAQRHQAQKQRKHDRARDSEQEIPWKSPLKPADVVGDQVSRRRRTDRRYAGHIRSDGHQHDVSQVHNPGLRELQIESERCDAVETYENQDREHVDQDRRGHRLCISIMPGRKRTARSCPGGLQAGTA